MVTGGKEENMHEDFTGKVQIDTPSFEADALKGFSRTIDEIQWLLVVLVLLYQIVQGREDESAASIYYGLLLYSVFIAGFRYFYVNRDESRWKLAIETWVMIVFITWVIYYSGRLESPLVNLYLLTVIISSLTLGRLITLLEVALIAACYIFLGYSASVGSRFWAPNAADLVTRLAPMLLVAYITTMLAADIRSALSRIKLISETDELTGIYNLRAFTTIANRTHTQSVRYGHAYSIVMFDSDNLKAVNDTYGHEAGNRLLKLTVTCIQQLLREYDVFARYGGDEFVVQLPQATADGAFEFAERVRKMIESTPLDTKGRLVSTTVSVGIAAYPEHGEELAALINSADQALYNSKNRGRNRTSVSGDQ